MQTQESAVLCKCSWDCNDYFLSRMAIWNEEFYIQIVTINQVIKIMQHIFITSMINENFWTE